MNENIGAQKVNLLMSQLKIDEFTMTKFIKEMTKTERKNRNTVIKKYFNNWKKKYSHKQAFGKNGDLYQFALKKTNTNASDVVLEYQTMTLEEVRMATKEIFDQK